MGSLRQLTEGGNILRCGDGERFKKFSATIETISSWSDYGQYNEDRIHLLQDGKEIPVKIGQWEFWPLIKDIHYWQKKSEASNFHKVTLNGRDAKMQLFEVTFVIDGEELLPGIIYAMIIFSRVNDIKLGKEYWDSLTGKRGLSDGKDFVDNERIERITGAKLYFRDIVDEEYDEPSFNGDYSNTYLVLLEKRPDYSALDSLVASGRWQKSEGGYHFSAIWGNDLPAPEGEDPNEDRMLTIRIPFDSDTISLSTGMW